MPAISQALSTRSQLKTVQLGPLRYALIPHDLWGEQVIAAIDRYFPLSLADIGDVNRVVHLKRLPADGSASVCPEFPELELHATSPAAATVQGWQRHSNRMNTVWHSAETPDALWTAPADGDIGTLRFHLPWDLLLHDLAALGGGLIHGGVAIHNQRVWLFLAPPGGGKSTTLATAPTDWQVLCDDAAMIWPEPDGHWRLFPLLSWSTMLAPPAQPVTPQNVPGETFRLGGMLALNKATDVRFERLSPVVAAAHLYCALTQYPAIFLCDHIHHEPFFRSACRLARQVPCWQLDLPLGGNIWPGVAALERACE